MAAMETLSQAINRLITTGYAGIFRPTGQHLVCGRCDTHVDPATMAVDEIVRFEGVSDPDDQAILYALDAECGHRGLYTAAYGVDASSDDIAVLLALPNVSSSASVEGSPGATASAASTPDQLIALS